MVFDLPCLERMGLKQDESGITVCEKKNSIVLEKDGEKICVKGKTVFSTVHKSGCGSSFQEITADEAKKRHLGQTRSIGKVTTPDELKHVIEVCFSIEIEEVSSPKSTTRLDWKAIEPMSDDDLVLLYRRSEGKVRARIFYFFLMKRKYKTRTWIHVIEGYANTQIPKLKMYRDLEVTDLYQEGRMAFEKTIARWYDINGLRSFSTHAIDAIQTYVRRVFSVAKKEKRKLNVRGTRDVEIYDPFDGGRGSGSKLFEHVISTEDVGNLRTERKTVSYEKEMFYRTILLYLQKSLELQEVEADPKLQSEIVDLIRRKKTNRKELTALAERHSIPFDDIMKLKQTISENLEKLLYRDIINFYEADQKGTDEILAEKFNRSRAQITKSKARLSQHCKRHLSQISLSTSDVFD